MKKIASIVSSVILLGYWNMSSATTLDFNAGVNPEVTLGGSMEWNNQGGGHLYMENYDNTDSINFAADTYVNKFEMNYQPWEGYGSNPSNDSGWSVDIRAFDGLNNLLWSGLFDLSSTAGDWGNWLTISVETANVRSLSFGPTGDYNGYWPSIDNLVINEQGNTVPEPTSLALLSLGFAGMRLVRRKTA